MTSTIWSPSAGITMYSSRRRSDYGKKRGPTSQTAGERRLSKLAAAINQKWRRTGNAGVPVTAADLASIWLNDSGKCRYCGIGVDLMGCSFDHVVPFAENGVNEVGNIATACITCQRSKYTKSTSEFAEWQELERTCRGCGVQFKPRWADVKRGYGWYHSRSCSARASRA